MNKRIKKLWIKALMSGDYQQGVGSLRNDGEFCCLGVLCDLHAKRFKAGWERDEVERSEFRYAGESEILPYPVREWAGLKSNDPTVRRIDLKQHLSTLNDRGVSFPEIAKLIEQHL